MSVIVPVRNEAGSIECLIRGLQGQTYRPAEIVIADGGSTDETRNIIRHLQLDSPIPIVLIEDNNALPGRGRNLAITRATNEWIACIDAGIVPEADWLEQLVRSVERQPDKQVIYGKYWPVTRTHFAECAAISYAPPPGTLAPSIASCLLRRSVWKSVRGFREDLRSGEDLLFFRKLEALGVGCAHNEKAVVHWELQPTIGRTFRRFAVYSHNGMKAGLAFDWQMRVSGFWVVLLLLAVMSWFWWPLIALPFILLIVRAQRRIYRWYAMQPRRRWAETLNVRRVLMVAWINFVIDMAMFLGMARWFLRDWIGIQRIPGGTENPY